MQQKFPEIELFMWSLYQEYPDGFRRDHNARFKIEAFRDNAGNILEYRRIVTVIEDGPDGGTPPPPPPPPDGGWNQVTWAIKFQEPLGDRFGELAPFPLAETVIREEDFGAIVFDPRRDRLFRANKPGYKLLKQMLAEHGKSKSLAKFETDAKVSAFVAFLKGADLWTR